MRWLRISCFLLACALPLVAEDWTTEDGKTYKNVTVQGQEDDGVRITFDGGAGKIPYYELPVDIQKRFGQDIESLAAKKAAVDKAIEDAVKSAASAEQGKQPLEPGEVAPAGNPNGVTPGAPGSNGMPGGVAPGNASVTPGGVAPGLVAPGGPTPSGPAAAGTTPGGTPARPAGTNAAPGAQAPGTAAVPGAHPAGLGAPGRPEEGMPDLAGPIIHTPAPNGVTGAGGKPLELSVSKYTYNSSLDVCYLDSPPVDVFIEPPPKTSTGLGEGSSLVMRIVTDGPQPQAPDRFEATFLSVGGGGSDIGTRAIVFNVDDGQVLVDDSAKKDSGTLSSGGQGVQYVSFYLTPDQARKICTAKALTLDVGGSHYKIDEKGTMTLRNYITDVDGLAPASSSFVRSFYKLLARIPSFFSILSTVCEYVIVGSFALLIAATIAAFILGVTRFIKM
jgi:hypothetical protein